MGLDVDEFIRRFLLHVLPRGFVRIRYYGLLANRVRKEKITRCRALLAAPEPKPRDNLVRESIAQKLLRLTGVDIHSCPICHEGRMRAVAEIDRSRRHRLRPARVEVINDNYFFRPNDN
jgi:hypothetical protein